ncbi:hypothetical protein Ccrd_010942 [Cynara cardunculus var. scolymus]|uniref:beta-ketoacyl-[acyl-carrier-protein] synthase I n=1 Tax=Cynara cardunculus var. scolymus TaxID=59895 RepID=A0A103YK66_CYNCS|nr:hypothetical protein Ccrd_010942 [Cynara cardunculus var. scolymus]
MNRRWWCKSAQLCYRVHRSFSSSTVSHEPFKPPLFLPQRRVVVTGLGMVTPLGCGVETSWKRLIKGESGIRALSLEDLKMSGFDKDTQLYTFDQLTSKVAAIHGKSIARFISYALCAADEALRDANWIPSEQEEKEKTGVSIGGGIGSIGDILDASQLICEKGPNHAAVTACATGANSIGDAARMIQFGDADVMVAGGTEASIDALSIAGFCRSRALSTKNNSSPQEASRPFDCDRDGFVITPLTCFLMQHRRRCWRSCLGSDAHHITQPHADGRGAILAMSHALKQSGLCPDQVDYVTWWKPMQLNLCFLDMQHLGAIGHLLGAAGAVEAIFTVLAIHNGIAPLSLNLSNPDPIFEEDFMPLTASKEMQIRAALSNAFGFGGTNAALLFATMS